MDEHREALLDELARIESELPEYEADVAGVRRMFGG